MQRLTCRCHQTEEVSNNCLALARKVLLSSVPDLADGQTSVTVSSPPTQHALRKPSCQMWTPEYSINFDWTKFPEYLLKKVDDDIS